MHINAYMKYEIVYNNWRYTVYIQVYSTANLLQKYLHSETAACVWPSFKVKREI